MRRWSLSSLTPFLLRWVRPSSSFGADKSEEEDDWGQYTSISSPRDPIFDHTQGVSYYMHNDPAFVSENEHGKTVTVMGRGGLAAEVDVSAPLLSPAQMEHWKLDSLMLRLALHFLPSSDPVFLLPPGEKIFSLGPEMDKVDDLYRQKGLYTPSEMAHVFIPITPTYYVESREVIDRVPPHLLMQIRSYIPMNKLTLVLFDTYPMLFKVRRPRYSRSAVKLNEDFWFVRAHPAFKRANTVHVTHNADHKPSIGGSMAPDLSSENTIQQLYLNIFFTLVKHLPRSPTDAEGRYRRLHLVQWINSFTSEEVEKMKEVSPKATISLLTRHIHIFQLLTDDPSNPTFFCDKKCFAARLPALSSEAKGERPPKPTVTPPSQDSNPPEDELESLLNHQPQYATIEEEETAMKMATNVEVEEDTVEVHEEEEEGEQETSPVGVEEEGDASVVDMRIPIDSLYIRRIPPHISPRSWSNFNEMDTPDPELFTLVAAFLAVPPSLALDCGENAFLRAAKKLVADPNTPTKLKDTIQSVRKGVWRWVHIDDIYLSLTPAQRRRLPRYKGLVNFIRLHGEVFEVCGDYHYVIAHDGNGAIAPFTPSQRSFRYEERLQLPETFDVQSEEAVKAALVERMGELRVPTTRKEMTMIDPLNPLLDHRVLYEELARLLPNHAVVYKKFLNRIPPIFRAALPLHVNLLTNSLFRVFEENGVQKLQRGEIGLPESVTAPPMSLDDAVQSLRESIPEFGATLYTIRRLYLPNPALVALEKEFGSLKGALVAYPQYFDVGESVELINPETVVYLKN